jgi:hypothetical protein
MEKNDQVRELIKQTKKEVFPIEEWVKEITDSASTLPHYLEMKTFNILSTEIKMALQQNKITPSSHIMDKLDGYRYVDEINELFRGKYIRWIRLQANATLTNGAMVMDIKFLEEGIQILCRNGANRFIQFKFDECLVFQKLTDEEWMLLSVKSKI